MGTYEAHAQRWPTLRVNADCHTLCLMATAALAKRAEVKNMRVSELREALSVAWNKIGRAKAKRRHEQRDAITRGEERMALFTDSLLTGMGGLSVGAMRGAGMHEIPIGDVKIPVDYGLAIAFTGAGMWLAESRAWRNGATFGVGMLTGIAACEAQKQTAKWLK